MKELHLGVVFVTVLAMAMVIVAAGIGVWATTDITPSSGSSAEPQADGSNSMTVESVSIRNQTANGVVALDIGVAGDFDRATLGRALEGMYDDSTTNVSDIELLDVRRNGATVAITTDGRDSSAHVADRVEHHLDGIPRNETRRVNPTIRMNSVSAGSDHGSDSVPDPGLESIQAACKPKTLFYRSAEARIVQELRVEIGDDLVRPRARRLALFRNSFCGV